MPLGTYRVLKVQQQFWTLEFPQYSMLRVDWDWKQVALHYTSGLGTRPVNDGFGGLGTAEIAGRGNFTFSGLVALDASLGGALCLACAPGSTLDIGGVASGSDLPGDVTVGPYSFHVIGSSEEVNGSLSLTVFGSATLPTSVTPTAAIQTPFVLEGILFYPAPFMRPGQELVGHGTATVFLQSSTEFGAPAWHLTRLEYRLDAEAAPIPEPSTLVLLGTGGLVLLRRYRRASASAARRT